MRRGTPIPAPPLIGDNVDPDGTASIIYVYGPLGSGARVARRDFGHGTGVIRDGELRFQNSDGTTVRVPPGNRRSRRAHDHSRCPNLRSRFKKTF